jgi:hypothetical protein
VEACLIEHGVSPAAAATAARGTNLLNGAGLLGAEPGRPSSGAAVALGAVATPVALSDASAQRAAAWAPAGSGERAAGGAVPGSAASLNDDVDNTGDADVDNTGDADVDNTGDADDDRGDAPDEDDTRLSTETDAEAADASVHVGFGRGAASSVSGGGVVGDPGRAWGRAGAHPITGRCGPEPAGVPTGPSHSGPTLAVPTRSPAPAVPQSGSDWGHHHRGGRGGTSGHASDAATFGSQHGDDGDDGDDDCGDDGDSDNGGGDRGDDGGNHDSISGTRGRGGVANWHPEPTPYPLGDVPSGGRNTMAAAAAEAAMAALAEAGKGQAQQQVITCCVFKKKRDARASADMICSHCECMK